MKVMSKKQIIFLLILILLLGTSLRFYKLSSESFWQDEGATALNIKKYGSLEILNNIVRHGQVLPEYYPQYDDDLPAYPIILSVWAKFFGVSEFSLRAFSAILGSLALIAVFYIGRHLFNDKVALLSTFLASINLTLIWYSQEARQYSHLLFLSLLSVIFLLKSLKENKTKYIVGLLIVNALIIYSHFPWLMFIAFEGVYALYIIYKDYTKKGILHKKVIVALLIIGFLYLPIIGRAISTESNTVALFDRPDMAQLTRFGVQLSTWLYPSIDMRQKIYDHSFNFSLFEWALLLSVLLSASLIGLMFLIGIGKSLYKKKSAIFLLFMFFFPILFALVLSLIHPKVTVFYIKQMIYIIPAYLILVSAGILRTKLSKPLITIIIILSILPLGAYYTNINKQQSREAAEFLPANEQIFINTEAGQVVFQYYYGEKDNFIGVKDLDDLKSRLSNINSFWMVLTFTKYSDPEGKIKKFLNENYMLTEKKEFFDVELLHYKNI